MYIYIIKNKRARTINTPTNQVTEEPLGTVAERFFLFNNSLFLISRVKERGKMNRAEKAEYYGLKEKVE